VLRVVAFILALVITWAVIANEFFMYVERQRMERAIEDLERRLDDLGRLDELDEWRESLKRRYREDPHGE
jgi:hypothetical protein